MALPPSVLHRTVIAVGWVAAFAAVLAITLFVASRQPSSKVASSPVAGSPAADPPPGQSAKKGSGEDAGRTNTEPPAVSAAPASPSSTAPIAIAAGTDADATLLRLRDLAIPVSGVAAGQLVDTYTQARAAGAPHEAIDIMAARGVPVIAVEDGKVAKLFLSQAGGITLYQFDPTGRYAYYYAHLDRYADGLAESSALRKGQVIGYVGSTGNARADAPHLHFAIFKLGPERQWWRGTALNPYLVWRDPKT
ncbi:MAG: peptidoglycan DD-metalloendopeptidase family protein [Pseudomonadota bacterium]